MTDRERATTGALAWGSRPPGWCSRRRHRTLVRRNDPALDEDSVREIRGFEARNGFGRFSDIVEHAEKVTITCRGREVAHLVGARRSIDREAARSTAQRIRAQAAQRRLGRFDGCEWRSYHDEGRPWVWRSSALRRWPRSMTARQRIRAISDRVTEGSAVIPAPWELEVARSLAVAIRPNRMDTNSGNCPGRA